MMVLLYYGTNVKTTNRAVVKNMAVVAVALAPDIGDGGVQQMTMIYGTAPHVER